jgi:hypothetical protein
LHQVTISAADSSTASTAMMLAFLVSQLRDLQTHFSLDSHSILGLLPAADTVPNELSLALIGNASK